MERLGHTPYTVMTVTNIAAVANDVLWELNHFTLFTLLKRLTLLSLTPCINTLFYFDCLSHQELENIAHDGCRLV